MSLEKLDPRRILDPQCIEVLRLFETSSPAASDTVEDARALDRWRKKHIAGDGPTVSEVRRVVIPADAGTIEALVYKPMDLVAPGVLVWLHGGGWVVGSPDTTDDMARILAVASGCVVISVDYRLAPEHRFPAGLMDAKAAADWAAANAEALGAMPNRLAIGGDSAGGNLAAAVALLARDEGGPKIDFQLLAYPVLCRDLKAASRELYAKEFFLTAEMMQWNWQQYLERDEEASNPYASPLLAESLAGLPPTCVLLADCDYLHDEGVRYVERLREYGVDADIRTYRGMMHGFLACAGAIDAGATALRDGGEAVAAAFADSSDDRSESQPTSRCDVLT